MLDSMRSSKNFSNPLRCGVDWPLSYPRLSIDHLGAGPRCPSEIFPVHQVNGSPKIRDHPCGRPMAGQPSAGSRPAVAPLKVTDHLQASQLSSNLQEAAARACRRFGRDPWFERAFCLGYSSCGQLCSRLLGRQPCWHATETSFQSPLSSSQPSHG